MSRSIRLASVRHFCSLACLVYLLLCPIFLLATAPPVTFPGVVSVLSTGSISLSAPAGLTVDPSGNVYIADTSNNQIVRVDASGNASILAVTGLGTALSSPSAVAVDGSDNLYIADKGNSRIVLVSSSGAGSVVSTGAVTLSLPQGVALDASGNLFIADSGHNQIVKVSSGVTSVYSITGLGTALSTPKGLAEDVSGNLYIADSANNRIVKVTSGGAGSALNLSGLGTALSAPSGVAVDTFGNVYIADPGNNRIVSVTSLSALATGSLTLTSPKGVAVDVFGSVYVAESGSNNRIDSIQINTVGYGHTQLGSITGKVFYVPYAVTGGTTLTNLTIWTMGAGLNDFAGTSNPGTPCVAQLYSSDTTCTIAVQYLPVGPGLRQGGMILTSTASSQIYTTTIPLYGLADAPQAALSPGTANVMNTGGVSLTNPFQIAVDGSGKTYVGNYSGQNVVQIPAGGGSATLVSAGSYTLGEVTGVALNGAGDLFIADYTHSKIIEITNGGVISELTVTAGGSSIAFPAGLAVDVAGNLYIADYGNSRVVKVRPPDVTSATVTVTGTVVNTSGYTFGAYAMTGVAVDAAGNLYITDRNANKLIKVTAAGVAAEVTISGLTLSNPQGVAVDGMGNIYIADSGHNRIVRVTTAGLASAIQTPGLTSPTTIGSPFSVTVDASGNIYIPDWTNGRVVKVSVAAASMAFANTMVGLTSSDSPKTATVTNVGNQELDFSASPTYTANFQEDSGNTNPCTSSTALAPGTACDVKVDFTPQSVASLSTNIVVTNNHLNVSSSTQNIAVSGTGLTPGDATAVAVSANRTIVDIGQALTVTATVTDTAAGHTSTVPTGGVTFTDTVGSTSASLNGGSAVTLSNSVAQLTGVTLSTAGTHTITANYAGVRGSFLSSSNTGTVFVKKMPTVTLESSASPVLVSDSVIFTATVSAAAGTPTGSVAFYKGSTLLGSGTLASGAATYATSSLPAGTHSITAVYSGDTQFSSLTSSALSQVIADFSVAVASGGSQSATVSAGGTATYHMTIVPSAVTTFPAAVTLAASGAPTGSTVTITPQSIAAGAGTTNVTLTIQVPATTAALHRARAWAVALPLTLGMFLLPFGGEGLGRTGNRGMLVCLLFLALVPMGGLVGCGGSSKPAPQAKQCTVTVRATSGTVSHSTTVTLTVQP